MHITSPVLPGPLNEVKKRAVRAWWEDGIADLLLAPGLLLLGIWMHGLTALAEYPLAGCPWPLSLAPEGPTTKLTLGLLWGVGGFALVLLYLLPIFFVVKKLKRRFIAPIRGEINHPFWVPVETSLAIIYAIGFVLATVGLVQLNRLVTGDLRYTSAVFSASFAMINLALGLVYHLRRYLVLAAAGPVLTCAAEWFLVEHASRATGPQHFLQASAYNGHPLLTLCIWAGLYALCGAYGLYHTLKVNHDDSAA